jgi:hypothetical protein
MVGPLLFKIKPPITNQFVCVFLIGWGGDGVEI